MKRKTPYREVLYKKINRYETEIDFKHELSDGFGIPSIVVNCPLSRRFKKYQGYDEYGNKIKGIDFDECMDCPYFNGLGYGQEIYCLYEKSKKIKKRNQT